MSREIDLFLGQGHVTSAKYRSGWILPGFSEVEDPCQQRHRLAETWPTFETASLVVLGLLEAVQE